jgi:hypothetical protein
LKRRPENYAVGRTERQGKEGRCLLGAMVWAGVGLYLLCLKRLCFIRF